LGSPAMPPVLHPTAPARDAVPRRRRGGLGPLHADGNHTAAAPRPGRDTRPGLRPEAFVRGCGSAAGSRVRWRAAPVPLGAAGDRPLRPGLHPRRPGWHRLSVATPIATRKPWRPDMSKVPTLYEWMGGMPAIERLFSVFYSKVPSDPILAPLFDEM